MSEKKQKYFTILTEAGSQLAAKALAESKTVKLTAIAIGDGGGEVPEPDGTETALKNEVYRKAIDSSRLDKTDKNIAWVQIVVPADAGGFWIREFGVYAENLNGGEPILFSYGNHAPYYKIKAEGGQATTHEISIPVHIFSTESGGGAVEIIVPEQGYATHLELEELAEKTAAEQAEQDKTVWQLQKRYETELGKQSLLIQNLQKAIEQNRYKLCDFYHFRRDDICEKDRRFVPAFGGLIENADVKYPEAWDYLKNYPNNGIEPLKLSEEDWQYWVRFFGGIGGGITYVQNLEAKTLRVPDLRGMFFEGARLLYGQNVGNYHLDQMRPIAGTFQCSDYGFISRTGQGKPTGAFRLKSAGNGRVNVSGTPYDHYLTIELNTANLGFHYSGERTVPPAYFTLPTVFLGEYHGE